MDDADFGDPLLHRPEADKDQFVREFECSAERYGWAVMPNHGIDLAILDQASSMARVGGPFTSRYPRSEAAGPGNALIDLSSALDELSETLLASIARFLWLEPEWFIEPTRGRYNVLHAITSRDLAPGDSRFESADDPGEPANLFALTLASTDIGLEVTGRGGIRRRIMLRSGTLLITMGDMLQRLTNDVLPASSYRVSDAGASSTTGFATALRFSVPFRRDHLIRTLPECGFGTPRDLYPNAVLAGDLRSPRSNGTGAPG